MKSKLIAIKWLILASLVVAGLLLYDYFVAHQFLMEGIFLFTAISLLLANILIRLWESAKSKWLVPMNILLIGSFFCCFYYSLIMWWGSSFTTGKTAYTVIAVNAANIAVLVLSLKDMQARLLTDD